MAQEEKKIGIEIKGPTILHGKRAMLTRGKNDIVGVLLSNSSQMGKGDFVFQFTDNNGVKCVSPVTKEELENIQDCLIDY